MRQLTPRALTVGLCFCALLPLGAAQGKKKAAPKPKAPTLAQMTALQAQVKQLTEERDQLKDKVAAADQLEAELSAAQRSRDTFKEEAAGLRKDLDQLKASLSENQSSGEAILTELRQAKDAAAAASEENLQLKKDLAEARARLSAGTQEGSLVGLGPDILPARAINLLRVTPGRKKVDRGVVVVNVLVNELGEPLDVRLLQGLPGEGEWVAKAHEACLDAAKRLVFEPARTKEGTKVKVWQGVGFFLD